jgi:hypothetical protein
MNNKKVAVKTKNRVHYHVDGIYKGPNFEDVFGIKLGELDVATQVYYSMRRAILRTFSPVVLEQSNVFIRMQRDKGVHTLELKTCQESKC